MMQMARWRRSEQLQARNLASAAEVADLRLKGYAAWLLTGPGFLDATAQFAARWANLAEEQRTCFPLGRHSSPPPSLLPPEPTLDATTFMTDFRTHLDRWGLVQLAAWDLP